MESGQDTTQKSKQMKPKGKTTKGETTQKPIEPKKKTTQKPIDPKNETTQKPIDPKNETTQKPIDPKNETTQKPIDPKKKTTQKPIDPKNETTQKPIDPENETTQKPIEPKNKTKQGPFNYVHIDLRLPNTTEDKDKTQQTTEISNKIFKYMTEDIEAFNPRKEKDNESVKNEEEDNKVPKKKGKPYELWAVPEKFSESEFKKMFEDFNKFPFKIIMLIIVSNDHSLTHVLSKPAKDLPDEVWKRKSKAENPEAKSKSTS